MAEIRDPKRFYYAMRSKYAREAKQIGHKLTLAMTEEEDALQWSKYKKVLKRWRSLKKPEGVEHAEDAAFRSHWMYKPVFNEEYVELTQQLKKEYDRMNQAKSKQERSVIEAEIRAIKQKRYTVTTYFNRETGEQVTCIRYRETT